MTRRVGVARSVGLTASLSRVWAWSLLVGLYASVPLLVRLPDAASLDATTVVDAAIAFALGFLLVFRMNRAYERWWEARTLWGKLVNVSRNLAIKSRELAAPDAAERVQLRKFVVGHAYALRDHLRGGAELARVPGFDADPDAPAHVPGYLVGQIYALLSAWRDSDRISGEELLVLDREAREFLEVTGGCERIKNTLMAESFQALVRQALVLYLLYLPWTLAPDFGWLSVGLAVVIAYFVVGTEGIAHFVERPFGEAEDHLDLDAICEAIDRSVSEALETPEALG